MHLPGKQKVNTTTFEWLMTHNIVPLFFTTILAIIGIVGYFANIGNKVDMSVAKIDGYSETQKNQEKLYDLLNDQVQDKLKLVDQRCAVLGITATPPAKKTK